MVEVIVLLLVVVVLLVVAQVSPGLELLLLLLVLLLLLLCWAHCCQLLGVELQHQSCRDCCECSAGTAACCHQRQRNPGSGRYAMWYKWMLLLMPGAT